MLRLPSWLFSCALMLSAAGAVAACVLNPQPLPPETADSGPGANAATPPGDDGGGGADGGGAEDVSLNTGDTGSPPDGAADGESDAGDAAYDGPADAEGSSDGGSGDGADVDATDAPDVKGD